jgi:hypothetical protein
MILFMSTKVAYHSDCSFFLFFLAGGSLADGDPHDLLISLHKDDSGKWIDVTNHLKHVEWISMFTVFETNIIKKMANSIQMNPPIFRIGYFELDSSRLSQLSNWIPKKSPSWRLASCTPGRSHREGSEGSGSTHLAETEGYQLKQRVG